VKQAIHRTHRISEQGAEEHGYRTRRDYIRHIEQNFERALSFYIKAPVSKPGGEQKRKHDLRYEVGNP
jgi:hypothetical protein